LGALSVVERVEAVVAGLAVGLARHHLRDGDVRERLEDADHAEQQCHVPRGGGDVVRLERGDVRCACAGERGRAV
jgi:hypothetical protein